MVLGSEIGKCKTKHSLVPSVVRTMRKIVAD